MTSVRRAPARVNAAVTRPDRPTRGFGRILPQQNPRTGLSSRPGRQEPATGKNFPKRPGRQDFAVRNESSTPVSSAGFSSGSSCPASRMRTTASGYALAIRSICRTGSWTSW